MQKKVWMVVFLVVGIILMIGVCAFAELTIGTVEEGYGGGFRAKVGYFMPSDKDISDFWGSGLIFGGDYVYLFPYKSYGIAGGVDYFTRSQVEESEGEEIEVSWTVIPITGSFLYFLTEEKSIYVGAGIGYYSATISAEVEEITISGSESALGFHVMGGYNFGKYFGEVKISSADVKGINAGGISLMIGMSF